MDYRKIYNRLIERSKYRKLNKNEYYENHHIIPRCIGGSDNKDNLVKLTPEEHYLAHQLLVKIYPDNIKIVRAAVMMIPKRPSNKLYGWLKRKFSKVQSKENLGNKNSQYGTIWITNGKENKKIKPEIELEDGWRIGRVVNSLPILDSIEKCYTCKQADDAYMWYEKFCDSGCSSLREFTRSDLCDISQPALSKKFKKYVKEYNTEKGKKYKPNKNNGSLA